MDDSGPYNSSIGAYVKSNANVSFDNFTGEQLEYGIYYEGLNKQAIGRYSNCTMRQVDYPYTNGKSGRGNTSL